ncbi:MAG: DUF5808 domain-containing protein [Lachnospiraceae bacterium]|nr:DUF5808 domain-containing protein [Lachnospiraceae bacterium]
MESLLFGSFMFICLIPCLWISLLYLYPKKWKEKKIVLGVKRRKEFGEAGTEEKVEAIVNEANRQATAITLVCTVIGVILLFLHGFLMQMFIWCGFIYIALLADMVPYILGHAHMIALKRELGLSSEQGVSYVDLKAAGKIRALKLPAVLLPNIAGLLAVGVAVLTDLGVIRFGNMRAGVHIAPWVCGMFWLMGILITVLAFLMDNMKNEVIASDSDVNANFNRAKKKNRANMNITFLWVNAAYILIIALFTYSEMITMLSMAFYMILLLAGIAVFVSTDKKIEARYQKQTDLVSDDDECWIGGMIYYNPKDRRFQVEKRAGVGATVNLAHPGGKIVVGLAVLALVLCFVWLGMIEATPIDLRVEDGKLICHQLRDEYVIRLDEIESVSYGEDIGSLQLYRLAGVGMPTLLKGDFSAKDITKCKVFLAPQEGVYIMVKTGNGIYIVSDTTAAETKEIFEQIR